MIIYKDIISGDEVGSDSFPHVEVDDVVIELTAKKISVSNDIDESLLGANASAEEAAEGTESAALTDFDVVISHQLQRTSFDKKSYMAYIKGFMKTIKERLEKENPDRVKVFTEKMPPIIKKLLGKFDELEFFTGASQNFEGLVLICDWREDGVTPYFILFKDALKQEKC